MAGAGRKRRDRGPGRVGGGDDLGAAEAGEVERLRRRDERDPPRRRLLGDGQERDVLGAGERQRRVDLVGEDPGVVLGGEPGERLELGPAGGGPGRVVGIAEQERPGAVREGGLDPVEVELAAAGQRHLGEHAAGVGHEAEERVVDGWRDDDPITGLEQRPQQVGEAGDDVVAGDYLAGVDAPSPARRSRKPARASGSPAAAGFA